MGALRVLTAAEQVGEHLRAELCRGAWGGRMPGGSRLAVELGVGRDTVEAALRLLEQLGMLVPQGAGRRRRIVLPDGKAARPLRVAILDIDPQSVALADGYMADLLYRLGEAGHSVFFADKCLQELHMNVGRVARLVRQTGADAWVVGAGSREVLEWFAAQPVPVFALFGRRRGLPIAGVGPDQVSAHVAVTRRLIELGHRRIVMLARRMRRLPVPGAGERAVLDEMAAHGIETCAFNLPDWEETSEGFHKCLKELFRLTPPTAMIIDEAPFLVAALQFLGGRGLQVPGDVSLVCSDGDPAFLWCQPTIAHIRWDSRPVVRRIVRWAANVSRGEKDLRQTLTKAEFFEGGTIGPA
jgi:DNA-binding LacI/PurR family transcriptional regulator